MLPEDQNAYDVHADGVPLHESSVNGVSLKLGFPARMGIATLPFIDASVARIEITNHRAHDLGHLTLALSAEPAFLPQKLFRIEQLKAGASWQLDGAAFDIDPAFLRGLAEPVNATLAMSLRSGETELVGASPMIELTSATDWPGLAALPETLATFVNPNDAAVAQILTVAAAKLEQSGRQQALAGYETGNKSRVWELVEAVFAAAVDADITYMLAALPDYDSPRRVSQPAEIMARKSATALELATLLAALLEKAGLETLIGFGRDMLAVGVWMEPSQPGDLTYPRPLALRQKLAQRELMLFDPAMVAVRPRGHFRAAVARATGLVAEPNEANYGVVIDIAEARRRQVVPLFAEALVPGQKSKLGKAKAAQAQAVAAPQPAAAKVVAGRLKLAKRNLADSAQNLPWLSAADPLTSLDVTGIDIDALAGQLATREPIIILPRSSTAAGRPRPKAVVQSRLAIDKLQAQLARLARAEAHLVESTGAHGLYLALGQVNCGPETKSAAFSAPILLAPVNLLEVVEPKGWAMRAATMAVCFNPWLLEKLRRERGLNLALEGNDIEPSGEVTDVPKALAAFEAMVHDVAGIELSDKVTLLAAPLHQHQIWLRLRDDTLTFDANPPLAHLIAGTRMTDPARFPDERLLDRDIEPCNQFMPLPADGAQSSAILAATYGQNFVLSTPPGTGKSQTLANMIVQLLGDGKTVLYVSPKATALHNLHLRLGAVGLGPFCLALHAEDTPGKDLLAQAKASWDARSLRTPRDWYVAAADLKKLKERLNNVSSALSRRHGNGLTVDEALGRVIRGKEFAPGIALRFEDAASHDEARMRRLRGRSRELAQAVDGLGVPAQHKLRMIGQTQWSPLWQQQVSELAQNYTEAAQCLLRTSAAAMAVFDLPACGDPTRLLRILTFIGQAIMPVAPLALVALSQDIGAQRLAFASWKVIRDKYLTVASGLSQKYRDGVFALDLALYAEHWRMVGRRLVLPSRRRNQVIEGLGAFAEGPLPADLGPDLARLLELKELRRFALPFEANLVCLGPVWQGFETSDGVVEACLTWCEQTKARAEAISDPGTSAAIWLERLTRTLNVSGDELRENGGKRHAIACLVHDFRSFDIARKKLAAHTMMVDDSFGLPMDEAWLEASIAMVASWSGAMTQMHRWCQWQALCATLAEMGLAPLVEAVAQGRVRAQDTETAFELFYARGWLAAEVDAEAVLRTFMAEQHEDAIERFVRLDQRVATLAQHVVAGRLAMNIPPRKSAIKDPELAFLARAIEHPEAHPRPAVLMAEAATALRRLLPCHMMSPASAARFLAPGNKPFDVLIIDEAAQLATDDALFVMAQARQVIVAGDQQELPPGAEGATQPESLLDACLGAQMPSKALNWHYRSRRESMIAFAHEAYYGGSLMTFPAPVIADTGLQHHVIARAAEDKPQALASLAEAQAVVAAAIAHLNDPEMTATRQSLGIVAATRQQAALIEDLLAAARAHDPQLAYADATRPVEPLFVKTIAEAQSDERDHVLLSLGFRADAKASALAPVIFNGALGQRALNVAIARARAGLKVFSSFATADLLPLAGRGAGWHDLHAFLLHADQAATAQVERPESAALLSSFETIVLEKLRAAGWNVRAKIGHTGQGLDFGIVHPDDPSLYLAGIICDGAAMEQTTTARERDRLRAQRLRELGWQVHHAWSLEWWLDSDRALARLQGALEQDLKISRMTKAERAALEKLQAESTPLFEIVFTSADEAPPAPPPGAMAQAEQPAALPQAAEPEASAPVPTFWAPYKALDSSGLDMKPDRVAFFKEEYQPHLRAMIEAVINTEGPVSERLLRQRIAALHGFARVTERMAAVIMAQVSPNVRRSEEPHGKIFWPEGIDVSIMPQFRAPGATVRELDDIPIIELASLAYNLMQAGTRPADLLRRMAQEAGASRLSERDETRIGQAVDLASRAA
ncbi:MAG: DUF3320 domain-containing protein [Hyphomicrobiales bacterium]|nr:DUF3320 domain-containing protein [Hyphomicrobiales bacterium]